MMSFSNLFMMMAPTNFALYQTIRITLFSLMLVCAIFLIIVVLMQPGNSSGISAISGETETFLGRNKSKTREGLYKKLTIIAVVAIVILSIAFFLVGIFFPDIV